MNPTPRTTNSTRRLRASSVAAVLLLTLGVAACGTPPSGGGGTSATTTTTIPCGTGASATATAPNGGKITITPATNLCQAGATITVSGTGFNATSNNNFGIYVAFGPYNASTFFSDALLYSTSKWIHTGAPTTAGQGPMAANGSFTTTLQIKAQFTNGNGQAINCKTTQCRVVTFAAHGVADRTQDSSKVISFGA